MVIRNPLELVDEFKKSGEFDRLRRELLAQFKNGDSVNSFMNRVEDITRGKLESDTRLRLMSLDARHAELLQELDRYPLVERAVLEVPAFSDPSFSANIRKYLIRILDDDRKGISIKEVHEDASLLALEEDNGLVIGRSTYGPSKNRASSSSPVAVRQFITDADGKVTLNGRSNHDTTYESNHRIKRDNFDDVVAAENVQQNEDITVDAKDSI